MRTAWVILATAAVFGLGCASGQAFPPDAGGAEEKGGEAPAPAPAGGPTAAEMEAWMKAATPGEPHRKLAELAGDWEFKGQCWMAPGGEAMEHTGTAKFTTLFEGRYQLQEFSGNFMGMPMQGMGILGYDNTLKEYVGAWISSMSTSVMASKGTADASGAITLSGECVNPMGEKETFREVMTIKDRDTIESVMFMKTPKHPEEFKFMELRYTRKK